MRLESWAAPEYSRGRVNAAGATLVDAAASPEARREALAVVHNWRAAHGWPLEVLQGRLSERVAALTGEVLLAQRLKRLSSIEAKLRRARNMQLARMQDIGGCRAVLSTSEAVAILAKQAEQCGAGHELLRHYDYLAEPRASGYRGVHLVFAYRPTGVQDAAYAGMRIEMQLRSRLQHAWATAVETVDTFSGQALKSSIGNTQWLRFFALMGSLMAAAEGLPLVPDTPPDPGELHRVLARCAAELDAVPRLEAYSRMLRALPGDIRNGDARYFHIYLELLGGHAAQLRWNEYAEDELPEAIRAYEEVEGAIQRFAGAETVLVRVDSVGALRRAYPNYFADTSVFLGELRRAIGEG